MSKVFADGISRIKINGIEGFTFKMRVLPDVFEKRVLAKFMRESMRQVREDARATVPSLTRPVVGPLGIPRRLSGTVRKAISVRTSKVEAKAGNIGVFVNVKPLPGNIYKGRGPGRVLVRKSARSADNPRDPFFWRWLEFGTQRRTSVRSKKVKDHNGATRWVSVGVGNNRGSVRAYAFLQHAAGKLGAAKDDVIKKLAAWAVAANKTGNIE